MVARSVTVPSMLNTASTTMIRRRPSVRRSTRARWSMSLCRYKVKSAPDNLAASNRLRWFSASWMIMSPDSHSALIAARLL
ncbi:Uncharacterised protein [Mycobacterium tuberculosis]|uniref:Uncharacterized protein n=1 Tax=Mycobacterium tuberculosis TaxID=1773 RepID=A0A655IIX5_MYCTX|nr:Uncharacterised protein [Mycobacterium tuberculosis]